MRVGIGWSSLVVHWPGHTPSRSKLSLISIVCNVFKCIVKEGINKDMKVSGKRATMQHGFTVVGFVLD